MNHFLARLCRLPSCGARRLGNCRASLVDRCANKHSLFPPPAAVVCVAPETRRSCGSKTHKTKKTSAHQTVCRGFWLRGWDLNHTVLTNSLRRICLRSPRGSDSPPDCHSLPLGRSLRSLPPSYSPFGPITRSRMSVSTPITKKNSVAQMGN